MRSNFFTRLYDMLIGDPTEYRKRHTYRVKFNRYWQFRDKDTHDRQLILFRVHGEWVPAYSRKDAVKRWVHADIKNRRKRSRR